VPNLHSLRQTARGRKHALVRQWEPTWRLVFNRADARAQATSTDVLGTEAQRMLADLERDGVAVGDLTTLTGDPELLGRLQDEVRELEAAHAAAQASAGSTLTNTKKSFLVELLGRKPVVDPTGTYVQLALHPQIKGVVDGYFRVRTRVADVNVWRNLVTDEPASSSQLWHRDIPDDRYVVKVFLYLEDVDEGGGPFSYVPRTHLKGSRGQLTATAVDAPQDTLAARVDDDGMAQAVPRDQWVVGTGKAGTIMLADTGGYHKGGLARTSPRLLFQGLYQTVSGKPRYSLGLQPGHDPAVWRDCLILSGR
jgi:hypothetical protein